MNQQSQINSLKEAMHGLDAPEIIKAAYQHFGQKMVFASSLGEEDQVLTDMLARFASGIEIFTLDTGRLFPETYDLIDKVRKRYGVTFKIYYPDARQVEAMVATHGINLFYDSIEKRKMCCGVRKVEPLKRALADVDAWMTGIRRAQAISRQTIDVVEWDDANQRIKINPLYNWSLDQVHAYITEHQVDVHPLHRKGFLSIGCAPCTRAIKEGEDVRAGRWWWENPESKECGLHQPLPKKVK